VDTGCSMYICKRSVCWWCCYQCGYRDLSAAGKGRGCVHWLEDIGCSICIYVREVCVGVIVVITVVTEVSLLEEDGCAHCLRPFISCGHRLLNVYVRKVCVDVVVVANVVTECYR